MDDDQTIAFIRSALSIEPERFNRLVHEHHDLMLLAAIGGDALAFKDEPTEVIRAEIERVRQGHSALRGDPRDISNL